MLNERLSLTADIYQRNTNDLVYSINLPGSTGYSTILANIGKIRNAGMEISISAYLIRNRNFSWNIDGNWSTNNNKLIKANVPLPSLTSSIIANKEGEPFNSFYLARWAGVNSSDGSQQWIDSTGKPNSDYASAKQEFVGTAQPDGFGSVTNRISFKGIEVSAMLYYQYGNEVYSNSAFDVTDGFFPYKNQPKKALDRWQKPGDIADNPKRILDNYNVDYYSTRHLFEGDHIRLQNVTIGYNFPFHLARRLHFQSLKLFVQGNNLALWTKESDFDPSLIDVIGQNTAVYPAQRSLSIGLNLNF